MNIPSDTTIGISNESTENSFRSILNTGSESQVGQKNSIPPTVLITIANHFLHIPHQLYALSLVSKHFYRVLTQDEIWDKIVRYWFPDADIGNTQNLKGLNWWRYRWSKLWKNSCVIIQRQLLKKHFESTLESALNERRNLTFMWYDGSIPDNWHKCNKKSDQLAESSTSLEQNNLNSHINQTTNQSNLKIFPHLNQKLYNSNSQSDIISSLNSNTYSLDSKATYSETLGFLNDTTQIGNERKDLIEKFLKYLYDQIEKDSSRFSNIVNISYFEVPMQYDPIYGCDSKKEYRIVRDVLFNPTRYKKSHSFISGVEIQAALDSKEDFLLDDNSPYTKTITFNMKSVIVTKQSKPILQDLTKYKAFNISVAKKIIEVGDRIVNVMHQGENDCSCPMSQVVQFKISQFHTTVSGIKYKLSHHVNFVIVPPQSSKENSICPKNYSLNKLCHELATFKLKELFYTNPSELEGKFETKLDSKNDSKLDKDPRKRKQLSQTNSNVSNTQNKQKTEAKKKKNLRKKYFTLLGNVCEVSSLWSQFVGIVDADDNDKYSEKMINLKEYALKELGRKKKKTIAS